MLPDSLRKLDPTRDLNKGTLGQGPGGGENLKPQPPWDKKSEGLLIGIVGTVMTIITVVQMYLLYRDSKGFDEERVHECRARVASIV